MKILITPRSFGKSDPTLFTRLENAGLEIVRNETGGILSKEQMIELIAPCAGVILGVDPMDKDVLGHAPALKVISRYGVGLDNVDLGECEKRNIAVFRTLDAIENTVADYAVALMLAVARRICLMDRQCRDNDWKKVMGTDLCGRTLGIIGLGAIGKRVARRCHGFEMRILASDINWDSECAKKYDIVRADIDKICSEADFISLHCSLTEETRHLINSKTLGMMKKNAILINTARGALVDDESLLQALREKRIFGAGLDVFEKEPPCNPEWRKLDNVVLGSHCASSTKQAGERMGRIAVDNLLSGLGLHS